MKPITIIWTKNNFFMLIICIIWAINFRLSFKNVDMFMDEYVSIKYNLYIVFAKNVLNLLCFIPFWIEVKKSNTELKKVKKVAERHENGKLVIEYTDAVNRKEQRKKAIWNYFIITYNLTTKSSIAKFTIKNLFLIFLSYAIEEAYFMVDNNHIFDRIVISHRNLCLLISTCFFSYIFLKNKTRLYLHQLLPLLIMMMCDIILIVVTWQFATNASAFTNSGGQISKLIYSIIIFLLMGLENVINKYLVDEIFLSVFLVLGIKGIFGTIIFGFLLLAGNDSLERNLKPTMKEDEKFENWQKIMYVISLVFVQFFKLQVTKMFTEHHILCIFTIMEILFFPLYLYERMAIQKFEIISPISFWFHLIVAIISVFLMLIINEIIEINILGLSRNTKKNINVRLIQESMMTEESLEKCDCLNLNDTNQETPLAETQSDTDMGNNGNYTNY